MGYTLMYYFSTIYLCLSFMRDLYMQKICKYCKGCIIESNRSYKNGLLRNECKPCRVKNNVMHKRKHNKKKKFHVFLVITYVLKLFLNRSVLINVDLMDMLQKIIMILIVGFGMVN